MAGNIDVLIDTNSRLEQRNAALEATAHEHTALLSKFENLQGLFAKIEAEARDARADKASLEQEVRLSGAQRAAKRINTLITVVPNALMVAFMLSMIVLQVLWYMGRLPAGASWVP